MKHELIALKLKVLGMAFATLVTAYIPSVDAELRKPVEMVLDSTNPSDMGDDVIIMDDVIVNTEKEPVVIETVSETILETKPVETEATNLDSSKENTVVTLSTTGNVYEQELEQFRRLPYFINENKDRYVNYKTKNPSYSYEDVITHVNIGLDHAFYTNVEPALNPGSLTVLTNKYRQLPEYFVPELATISNTYSSRTLQVTPEAKIAFETMCSDASKLGLTIKAVSAYRSYDYQYNLYWSKANPKNPASIARRDKVSARAGFSEHQTGLTLDIVGLDEWVDTTNEYAWYKDNAHLYGFILRYPKGKDAITGYQYEPWHIRYVGIELATAIYQSGLTYDEYYTRYIEPQLNMQSLGKARIRI